MKRPRGMGGCYLRGNTWWIRYSRNGHLIRESAETTDERKAIKLLNKRVEEAKKPNFVGPSEKRLTLDDLESALKADYTRHNRKTWKTAASCLKAARQFFKYDTLLQIAPRIEAYQDWRLNKCGKERGTINRECSLLRRGFRLLHNAKKISEMPLIRELEGENVREGFINAPEFNALLAEIKNEDTRDIIEFLYRSAWRSGEAKTLTWDKFDANDWVIRLSRKNEKTKNPRVLALADELKAIIERRLLKRLPDCPLVFHHWGGKPIKNVSRSIQSGGAKGWARGRRPARHAPERDPQLYEGRDL